MATMYGEYVKEDAGLDHFLKIICSNHKRHMHPMSRPKINTLLFIVYVPKNENSSAMKSIVYANVTDNSTS